MCSPVIPWEACHVNTKCFYVICPVTTDPKGEGLEKEANTPTLANKTEITPKNRLRSGAR